MTKYYVNADTGDDTNDGLTSATAWETANKALTSVVPGDEANFQAGQTWPEKLVFPGGVTYRADGSGDRPIFDGAGLADAFRLAGDGGIIEDLVFKNGALDSGSGLIISTYAEIQTGWVLRRGRSTGGLHGFNQLGNSPGEDWTFEDWEADNNKEFGISLYGDVQKAHVIRGSAHNNGRSGVAIKSDQAAPDVLVQGVEVYDNTEDGIGVNGTAPGQRIEDCIAYRNGITTVDDRTGIKSFAPQSIIKGCLAFRNGGGGSTINGHGIQLDYGADGGEVTANTVWGNAHSGISVGAINAYIHSNKAVANGVFPASFFGAVGGARFHDNSFDGPVSIPGFGDLFVQ